MDNKGYPRTAGRGAGRGFAGKSRAGGFALFLLAVAVLALASYAGAFCITNAECAAIKCPPAANKDTTLCNSKTGQCYCGPKTCGNLGCDRGENFINCPSECAAGCGNLSCELGENGRNCPADCRAVCGNKVCETGETESSCFSDCGGKLDCCEYSTDAYAGKGACVLYCAVCGDGYCDRQRGEDRLTCSRDCGMAGCGDGICGADEDALNCPADCPKAELACDVNAHCNKLPSCNYAPHEENIYYLAEKPVFNVCSCITGMCAITLRARDICGDGFCSRDESCDPTFDNFCNQDCGTCRLPDLALAGLEADKAVAESGEGVAITAAVENLGSKEAGKFSISVFRGSEGGQMLETAEIPGLFLTPGTGEEKVVRFGSEGQQGVAPLAVEFEFRAEEGKTVERYDLDFDGDGTFDLSLKPPVSKVSHTYGKPGFYRATTTVRYADGSGGESSANITALEPQLRHTFNLDTTGMCGEVLLVVKADAEGIISEASRENNSRAIALNINCPALPVAVFTVSHEGRFAKFDASASHSDEGDIVQYRWDFGGGKTIEAADAIAEHTYETDGNFSVKLVVVNAGGKKGAAIKNVVVGTPPSAKIRLTNGSGIVPLKIGADASASSDSDGEIVSYAWKFGDLESAEGIQAEHTYLSPGVYSLLLEVVDDAGLRGSAVSEVVVFGSQKADIAIKMPAQPGDVERENEITLEFLLSNIDGGNAGAFDLVLREGKPDGKEVARESVQGIKSTESVTVKLKIKTPEDLGPVDYYVVADPEDRVRESNKRDNVLQISLNVILPEICGNDTDDDIDGYVDEGCGVSVEVCANKIDDDGDGKIDEGCTWTEAILEGGHLIVSAKEEVVTGERAVVEVSHPRLGPVEGAELKIISPQGKETRLATDSEGKAVLMLNEVGEYALVATKYTLRTSQGLAAVSQAMIAERLAKVLPVALFGQVAIDQPLLIMLLLALCALVAVLVFESAERLFTEAEYVPAEARQKRALKYALALAVAAVPLLINKVYGFEFGTGVAAAGLLAMLFITYSARKVDRPWEAEGEQRQEEMFPPE
ncbi:MAG: PKD domain-containing protein [Candidatus Diapherotrites archaeon]